MLTSSMLFSFMPWQCASIQLMPTKVPSANIYFQFIKRLKAAFSSHVMAEIEIATLLSDSLEQLHKFKCNLFEANGIIQKLVPQKPFQYYYCLTHLKALTVSADRAELWPSQRTSLTLKIKSDPKWRLVASTTR